MNIDSDKWQSVAATVYKLFTDHRGQRCNEFTIQISGDTVVTLREKQDLAERIAILLNKEGNR